MKTKIILIYLVLTLLLNLYGCNVSDDAEDQAVVYEKIIEAVTQLNENSILHFNLLTLASEADNIPQVNIELIRTGEFEPPPPGEFDILDDAGAQIGVGAVMPFPWLSDDLCLIAISWDVMGLYNVFGIDIGDSLEKAESAFGDFGYTRIRESEQTGQYARFSRRIVYEIDEMEYVRIVLNVLESEGSSNIGEIILHVDDPLRQFLYE